MTSLALPRPVASWCSAWLPNNTQAPGAGRRASPGALAAVTMMPRNFSPVGCQSTDSRSVGSQPSASSRRANSVLGADPSSSARLSSKVAAWAVLLPADITARPTIRPAVSGTPAVTTTRVEAVAPCTRSGLAVPALALDGLESRSGASAWVAHPQCSPVAAQVPAAHQPQPSGSAGSQYPIHVEYDAAVTTHRPRICLLYTSPSPRDRTRSRMPSSA